MIKSHVIVLSFLLGVPFVNAYALTGDAPATDVSVVNSNEVSVSTPTGSGATGKVISVDQVRQLIKVQDNRGQVKEFIINSTTPILGEANQPLTFYDLAVGSVVAIKLDVGQTNVEEVRRIRG